MLPDRSPLRWIVPALALLFAAACGAPEDAEEAYQALVDESYLTADLWNDGQAEVAFYRVERDFNQYGQPAEQSFLVGTYLVKHNFSAGQMTKATDRIAGEPTFKYALFYEFESGSYQYKRNYVTNARQRDLRPFKQSFTSFDWCSNLYEEFAFHMTGAIDYLKRSDDYGNEQARYVFQPRVFPAAEVPLLVRALDFSAAESHTFTVLHPDGTFLPVTARSGGRDSVELAMGTLPAERVRLTYSQRTPSPIAESVDSTETYWRGTGPARRLLRLESGSGSYRMELVEHLRSAYWDENLWPRLERVEQRP
jgi:hypothetical protein